MNDLGWLNKGKLRGLGGMLPNEQFLIKTVEGGYLQEQLNRRAEFSELNERIDFGSFLVR